MLVQLDKWKFQLERICFSKLLLGNFRFLALAHSSTGCSPDRHYQHGYATLVWIEEINLAAQQISLRR
uniref:Uncharacterized protein n=1 Tax=Arundo donax TaxID=35708 RepID=A0A0A9GRJ0_ARUDO